MRVDYRLSKEDYINFNLHHIEKNPRLKKSLKIQRFFIPSLLLLMSFFIFRGGSVLINITPALIAISIIWFVFFNKLMIRSMDKKLIKLLNQPGSEYLLEEKALEINNSGLYEIVKEDKEEKTILASEKIYNIEEEADSIYLYISQENAYIIPNRFFDSEAEKNKFIEEAEKIKK